MKAIAALLLLLFFTSACPLRKEFRCKPCGHDCDRETFAVAGTCTHCQMALVDAATITQATVAPGKLCNWIAAHPSALLLDVRTPEEFAGKASPDFGSLKGAINIPVNELGSRIGELSAYRSRPILVYCSHSHRSSEASYLLTQKGFLQVTNMAGGMSALPDGACKR
jgi:rhodanese-related sulfurtransferase